MRRHIVRIFAILSCLLAEVGLLANELYPLKRIEVEDGLSQNMVYGICQDKRDFMWFGTQGGLNRYDGNTFKIFGSKDGLENDKILCSKLAPDGKIWVGTVSGLYFYDPESERFSSADVEGKIRDICFSPRGDVCVIVDGTSIVKINSKFEKSEFVSYPEEKGIEFRSLCFDGNGLLWAAGYSVGLIAIKENGETSTFHYSKTGSDLFTKVIEYDGERLLVGTIDLGLLDFNIRSHRFSTHEGLSQNTVDFVHDILPDSKGRLWLGAENGLFVCSGAKITHLKHIPDDPYSLSDNAIFSLFEDCDGGIWIGTYFGGINYYSEYTAQFRKYFPCSRFNGLKGKNISQFLENEDGSIWIGTEDAGLHRFYPLTNSFESGFVSAHNIHALTHINGKLWIGTYGEGLFIIDKHREKSSHYLLSKYGYPPLSDNIYCILETIDGVIFLGTDIGVFEIDRQLRSIRSVATDLIHGTINDIRQDIFGNIWVSTSGSGLFKRNFSSGTWEKIVDAPEYVTCILEDSKHDMWFGSEQNGAFHYDHNTGLITNVFTIEDGIPDKTIYMLLEDGDGNIWGSTNHGIFRSSTYGTKAVVFNHKSGLVCDQHNFRSGIKTKDGKFYFGGVKGFVGFAPEEIHLPNHGSKIVFNRIFLYNTSEDSSPLEQSIINSRQITLNSKQSSFSIRFSDLSYSLSGINGYQYRLKGLNENWTDLGKGQVISFSELAHGKYILQVRSDDDVLSPDTFGNSIKITILPPWYKSWWAWLTYATIALLLGCGITYFIIVENKRKSREAIEKINRQKEKELYDSKISFFTNITHEIRTPLTLITTPLEEIIENSGKDSPNYEDLCIVNRNAQKLLNLVNELLDFRKVESGLLTPAFSHQDIVVLSQETIQDFKHNIDKKKLSIATVFPDKLEADVDQKIFIKILSNILNNALKHAKSLISVNIALLEDKFSLSIINDGDRIPPSEAEHIFDPFVKLDDYTPGSGIGLPFARDLAHSHHGTLYLDTSIEQTCFTLELPLVQQNAVCSEIEESQPIAPAESGRQRILIAEDNDDLRLFLTRKIGSTYSVLSAKDGMEAAAILAKEMLDLVITDLMMPGMDGNTLCNSIKNNIATCHIPVIVITAKSDMNTRIACLRNGADDFISKPFQISYLMVRIENLLAARQNLRKAFGKNPDLGPSSISTSRKDEEFLQKIESIIEQRMEDPMFDVDVIAEKVNMSRATFYRKMKGLTDVSPNDFIRLCRLKKAAQILASGDSYVNEAAFSVGFSSASYFSRCFSKQFGVSPKEYAAIHSQQKSS